MKKRVRLTDREFVTAWAKAKGLDGVVEATRLSRIGAQARANRLRRAGVLLRRFGRPKKVIDVTALNDLLEKLGAKDEPRGRRK